MQSLIAVINGQEKGRLRGAGFASDRFSMKALQPVPPLAQQFMLNQVSRFAREAVRPGQPEFDQPRFDCLGNAIRFVLAQPHKPLPFVACHIPSRDHQLPPTQGQQYFQDYHNSCRKAAMSAMLFQPGTTCPAEPRLIRIMADSLANRSASVCRGPESGRRRGQAMRRLQPILDSDSLLSDSATC